MDDDSPNETTDVVAFIMAKGEMERIQSYMERGRRFRDHSDDRLKSTMIDAYKRWADDVTDQELGQLTNDIGAEYALRKEDPPYDLVTEDLDRGCKAVANLTMGLSDDRRAEINEEMVQDYFDAHDRQN